MLDTTSNLLRRLDVVIRYVHDLQISAESTQLYKARINTHVDELRLKYHRLTVALIVAVMLLLSLSIAFSIGSSAVFNALMLFSVIVGIVNEATANKRIQRYLARSALVSKQKQQQQLTELQQWLLRAQTTSLPETFIDQFIQIEESLLHSGVGMDVRTQTYICDLIRRIESHLSVHAEAALAPALTSGRTQA